MKYKNADNTGEEGDPYRVELKYNSGTYYVPVPDAAFECEELAELIQRIQRLEETEGDSTERIKLERRRTFYPKIVEGGSVEDKPEPKLDKDPPNYIRVDLSDNGERSYSLSKNPNSEEFRYALTCPSECLTFYKSPLTDLDKGDDVMLEVNRRGDQLGTKKNHLRVYSVDDYFRYRFLEWKKIGSNSVPRVFPVLGGIFSKYIDRPVDCSGPFVGDKFQLVAFDAHHPVFTEQSEREFNEHTVPSSDLFFKICRNGDLPQKKVENIEIWWDPRNGKKKNHDPSIKLFETENCAETSVILPKQGYFLVKSTTRDGTLKTWLSRSSLERVQESKGWERRVGDGWYGFFPEDRDDEDGVRLYVPAKTMSE
ncbi:hypothetical protein [Natrinema marinum]|uniref:hypothetical protein n=1 Tax=Natrinema marinum TaxID=2961598 RepID=UPI0020C8931E|nr:hypothetical protein [Natrinema marinum]